MNQEPLTEERQARRSAILRSAIETFAEHGFAAARTRDIAAGAGVAEGTIYLYFDGKDDLLLTAFRDRVNEFCGWVGALLEGGLPFPERLTRFIAAQFESIEREPALATVLLVESRQSRKFYAGAVREVLRMYAGAVEQLLRNGVDEGELCADLDVALARRIVIGTLEEIELDWLLSERTRPLTPLAPHVAATLYRGLATGPAV
ncbi:MAG TPA: TetR/AcrR family transcriptional regulator [Longimicrobiaceae bacterium]|nr:TetR/AcrR family transcriptional regulator [Longimicrobiaceae bacterium]